MIPLLAIGALLALGMAGAKKAQAAAQPAKPVTKARKQKITITKRTPKRYKARRKISQARKSLIQRLINARVKKITAKPITPAAKKTLSNLLQLAASKKTNPQLRAAAQREIKKIVARPASVRAAAVNRLPRRAKLQLAKAVINAQKTAKVTADEAARALQLWTRQGGNQGTRNNRSATVKKHQLAMGFTGSNADGIIGPKTRARAKQLGYPLAPRSRQNPGAVGADLLGYLPN